MVDGADLVRFIQHGVVENRICACAPSQRGCVGMVFEAKESLGGTPAARRRLAGGLRARLPNLCQFWDIIIEYIFFSPMRINQIFFF